jgi:hypothetical protein
VTWCALCPIHRRALASPIFLVCACVRKRLREIYASLPTKFEAALSFDQLKRPIKNRAPT